MRVRMAVIFGAIAVLAAGAAWLGTELVMAPQGSERNRLIAMFVAIAAGVFVLGLGLSAGTRRSLTARLLVFGVAGPLVVGVTTLFGAWSMFISSHDMQFVMVLTAMATVLAVGLSHLLGAPIVRDLERLRFAADQVSRGDLSARSELRRGDELGSLGAAFDSMAQHIEDQDAARTQAEADRQFLMSSLSHDARTPLTAMRAAVEALQDGLAPDPVRYLASIEHDLSAIEAIVENIFVLGRLDSNQLTPDLEQLDLAMLARNSIVAIEPLAEKHDVVLELIADGSVPINADRVETQRVIANLLSNAIRHSPASGVVQIETTLDPQPSLVVRDDGPGFPEAFIERAFDQFTRANADRNRRDGGAGLGLAVVKGLVEAQGGSVFIKPGSGGTVGFRLPGCSRSTAPTSM